MTHTNTNGKAPGACDSKGLTTNTNSANFRTEGVSQQGHDGKFIATQIARLTLGGHTTHRGSAGEFAVCKYGMARYCKDFSELQAFVRQLGMTQ